MYMALEAVPVCTYTSEERQHLALRRAMLRYSTSRAAELSLEAASGDQCTNRRALAPSLATHGRGSAAA